MIWEILDDWMIGLDMMISFNGKMVGMHDTMGDIGIDCTLRCSGRIRGGHDPAPSAARSYAVGPTGRPPQRSNPVNPTYRPNQRPSQPVAPTASVQKFSPVEPAIAGWSRRRSRVWFCSRIPSGRFGLAEELLAANYEP